MADSTTNYGFELPGDNDLVDQTVYNKNFEEIDSELAAARKDIDELQTAQQSQSLEISELQSVIEELKQRIGGIEEKA